MSKATINGIQMNYEVFGRGYPLVLCHGFTGNLQNWAFQIPELAKRYQVIAYDHRGHGHSEKPTSPDAYSMELLVEDLHQLLRHLGIDQCFLVGHSMGGMVVMRFILEHPEFVRALVLVDTAAGQIRWQEWEEERRIAEDIARNQGMEALFYFNVSRDPALQQLQVEDPAQFAAARDEFLLNTPEGYIYCGRALRGREPVLHRLSEIAVPTLIIVGENDEPLVEPARQMHRHLPGSELVIIPGAAHSPTKEAPETFNSTLARFLEGVASNPYPPTPKTS